MCGGFRILSARKQKPGSFRYLVPLHVGRCLDMISGQNSRACEVWIFFFEALRWQNLINPQVNPSLSKCFFV